MGIVTKFKEGINMSKVKFPPPLEVTGVSYVDIEEALPLELTQFPYPPEVNGGLTITSASRCSSRP